MSRFYVGDYRKDAIKGDNRNWIVGTFVESGPRKTKALEVKYWEFPVGETQHSRKVSATFECTIVLAGEIIGEIDGTKIRLHSGQYVVIPPGVTNNLVSQVLQPAQGFTVKAPSNPQAKQVLD